jgi:hypothetical protein
MTEALTGIPIAALPGGRDGGGWSVGSIAGDGDGMDEFLQGLDGDAGRAANAGEWVDAAGEPMQLGISAAPPQERSRSFLQRLFGG